MGSAAIGAAVAAALIVGAGPAQAWADDATRPPAVTFDIHETVEVWRNLQGGVAVGDTTLNKLQASAAFDGEAMGWRGLSIYAQVFKTNAESLSGGRTGDVQTASNIEAQGVDRLMELWVAQRFGDKDAAGWVLIRGGLIDLNRNFDSIEPAGLFIDSSHGIGPDLSHSGPTGPSIFPVSGLALQIGWRPTERLVVHGGVFASPDPRHQREFADLRLSGRNGAIAIAQVDDQLTDRARIALGVWRYTAAHSSLADPARRLEPRPGLYGFIQGQTGLPGAPKGWVRAGFADRRVQDVSGYVGAGLVWAGLVPGRSDDSFGLAVARARIGGPARRAGGGLPDAETTWEATYSFPLLPHVTLQPDVQHIVHPAGAPGLHSATVVGLRVSVVAEVAGD
jgi:porin